MAEAGRALCVPVPNPCPSTDSRSRVPRDTARQLLEISREEIRSLRAAVPVLSHLHSTEMLPDVQREPPVFQCVSMGYCPGTVYH